MGVTVTMNRVIHAAVRRDLERLETALAESLASVSDALDRLVAAPTLQSAAAAADGTGGATAARLPPSGRPDPTGVGSGVSTLLVPRLDA